MKRNENIELSVVMPYGYESPDFSQAVDLVLDTPGSIELIVVTTKELCDGMELTHHPNVRIFRSNEVGRGVFCKIGVQNAKGRVVLFLHADTYLPENWYSQVLKTMTDPNVSLGGFTVVFRTKHWLAGNISMLYSLWSMVTREFWGDRAMFMRKDDLLPHLDDLAVLMMEDVEMSKFMRTKGKLVLLPDVVSTGANHFTIKGCFTHILQVIYYRILYAFGVSSDWIYQKYYMKIEDDIVARTGYPN